MIDHKAVNEYLTLIGEKELPLNLFEVIELEDRFPVERVNELLNEKEDRIGLVPSVTNDNFYG